MTTLQALTETHIPGILAACANWEELAPYGAPHWRPRSSAELRRKIASTSGPQPATEYNFVLVDDDRLVGECSLHGIDWRNRVGSVGVCIWSPGDRRNGYGREAAIYMINWAFDYLGLERIEAWINEGNEPSLGLFQRLGFVHEGTLRQRYFEGRKRRDMHVLALLRE